MPEPGMYYRYLVKGSEKNPLLTDITVYKNITTQCIIYAIFIVIGVVGNCLVIYVSKAIPVLFGHFRLIVSALAWVDLAQCTLTIPGHIMLLAMHPTDDSNIDACSFLCKTITTFQRSLMLSSCYILAMLSYERQHKVWHPFSLEEEDLRRIKRNILFAFIFGVLVAICTPFNSGLTHYQVTWDNKTQNASICFSENRHIKDELIQFFRCMELVFLFSIFCFIVWTNLKIYCIMRYCKHDRLSQLDSEVVQAIEAIGAGKSTIDKRMSRLAPFERYYGIPLSSANEISVYEEYFIIRHRMQRRPSSTTPQSKTVSIVPSVVLLSRTGFSRKNQHQGGLSRTSSLVTSGIRSATPRGSSDPQDTTSRNLSGNVLALVYPRCHSESGLRELRTTSFRDDELVSSQSAPKISPNQQRKQSPSPRDGAANLNLSFPAEIKDRKRRTIDSARSQHFKSSEATMTRFCSAMCCTKEASEDTSTEWVFNLSTFVNVPSSRLITSRTGPFSFSSLQKTVKKKRKKTVTESLTADEENTPEYKETTQPTVIRDRKKSSGDHAQREQAEDRARLTLAMVVVFAALHLLPHGIYVAYVALCADPLSAFWRAQSSVVVSLIYRSFFLSCVFNPYVYFISDIRVRKRLRRLCSCKSAVVTLPSDSTLGRPSKPTAHLVNKLFHVK